MPAVGIFLQLFLSDQRKKENRARLRRAACLRKFPGHLGRVNLPAYWLDPFCAKFPASAVPVSRGHQADTPPVIFFLWNQIIF